MSKETLKKRKQILARYKGFSFLSRARAQLKESILKDERKERFNCYQCPIVNECIHIGVEDKEQLKEYCKYIQKNKKMEQK